MDPNKVKGLKRQRELLDESYAKCKLSQDEINHPELFMEEHYEYYEIYLIAQGYSLLNKDALAKVRMKLETNQYPEHLKWKAEAELKKKVQSP